MALAALSPLSATTRAAAASISLLAVRPWTAATIEGSSRSSCERAIWLTAAFVMIDPSRASCPTAGDSIVDSTWLVTTTSRANAASWAVNLAGSPSGMTTLASD